jgi:hypothetical protein
VKYILVSNEGESVLHPEDGSDLSFKTSFLLESHGVVISQKTAFFIVSAAKTSSLTMKIVICCVINLNCIVLNEGITVNNYKPYSGSCHWAKGKSKLTHGLKYVMKHRARKAYGEVEVWIHHY